MEYLTRRFPVAVAIGILVLLTASLAASMLGGLRTARRLNRAGEGGLGVIESSVFAIFGLLVAFTFTAAADRFTGRRGLIVEEAKTAQTSWDNLGLLPEPARSSLRRQLRSYLEAKLDAYQDLQSYEHLEQDLNRVAELGKSLVAGAVEACRAESGQPFVELILPPLNQLREVSLARRNAIWHHPPVVVYLFLIFLAHVCAFFSGFSLRPSSGDKWIQIAGFSLVLAAALYLTLDLEFPRMGLLRVDGADVILRGIVEKMG